MHGLLRLLWAVPLSKQQGHLRQQTVYQVLLCRLQHAVQPPLKYRISLILLVIYVQGFHCICQLVDPGLPATLPAFSTVLVQHIVGCVQGEKNTAPGYCLCNVALYHALLQVQPTSQMLHDTALLWHHCACAMT